VLFDGHHPARNHSASVGTPKAPAEVGKDFTSTVEIVQHSKPRVLAPICCHLDHFRFAGRKQQDGGARCDAISRNVSSSYGRNNPAFSLKTGLKSRAAILRNRFTSPPLRRRSPVFGFTLELVGRRVGFADMFLGGVLCTRVALAMLKPFSWLRLGSPWWLDRGGPLVGLKIIAGIAP
jgi:hypothetical protein